MSNSQVQIKWENSEITDDIVLTVGLPIFKGENIVWLALESLKNQKNIDFAWELIVWEEFGKSKDLIENYCDQLPNCRRVIYRSLSKKISLLEKWRGIASDASDTSKAFVMQDADDYSPPKRLWIHNEHFKNPSCYISTQFLGYFYNLKTKWGMFYYGPNRESSRSNFFTDTHLNNAFRTADMKRLKKGSANVNVHHHIKANIERLHGIKLFRKKHIFTDYELDRENWKYGFFTDGANNISKDRLVSYKFPQGVFLPYNRRVLVQYRGFEYYIPKEVRTRIIEYK